MRIAGLLSWYDESPAWLATAVAGMARFCDVIVAVDGAYALYPGGRPRSRPDQAEAVTIACEAAGVGLVLHQPSEVFAGNEVEKRNLTLQLARPFLEPGVDWVCAFDADYHVERVDPDIVRWELGRTDCNVASYTILDGVDVLAGGMARYAAKHDVSTEWTFRTRDLFRWTDDLRYERAHYVVRGTYPDVGDVFIKGPEMMLPNERAAADVQPCLDLNEILVVHHRTAHRAKVRNDAREGYYRNRDLAGVESLEAVA